MTADQERADRERAERLLRADLRDAFERVLRGHDVDEVLEQDAVIVREPGGEAHSLGSAYPDVLDDLVDAAIDVRGDR